MLLALRAQVVAATVGVALAGAPPVAAQSVGTSTRVKDVAINAAIGGVVSALRTAIGGRHGIVPLAGGVAGGVAGGAIEALGRQVAASSFTAAGLAGRELSALGTSIAVSASSGTLVLIAPLGPATLEYRPASARPFQPHVSLFGVVTIVSAAVSPHTSFDLTASLNAGAPVFVQPLRSTRDFRVDGHAEAGTIFVASSVSPVRRRLVLRHERVHVLQWDAYVTLTALPVERALTSRLPFGASVFRYVDPGVVAPLSALAVASRIRYENQPWEREAYALVPERTGAASPTTCSVCLDRSPAIGARRPIGP